MGDDNLNDLFGDPTAPETGGDGAKTYKKTTFLETPKEIGTETHYVCRILPPMHSLKASPKGWAKYHATHWGWNGTSTKPKKDGTVGIRYRPFGCIKQTNWQTKAVTVSCPVCQLIDKKTAEYESLKKEYLVKGLSEKESEERLAPLEAWLKSRQPNRKYYMNVVDTNNEFQVLAISGSCKGVLESTIAELRNEGLEPIGAGKDKGVWLRFTCMKPGPGPITYKVEAVQDSIVLDNGKTAKTPKMAPMTRELAERAVTSCKDLNTVVQYLSLQQMSLIVASNGDPDEVDRIWQLGATAEAAPQPKQAAPAPAPKPAVKTEDEDAEVKARLERIKAERAAKAAPVAEEVTTPTAKLDLSSMDDEAFFAQFGGKV